jgi:hypothetical protein
MTLAPELSVRETDATPGEPEADLGKALESDRECTLVVVGAVWAVSVAGTGRSGAGPVRGASLLLLRFTVQTGPESRAREVLAVARSLEELGFEELKDLFRRSRAAKDPETPAAKVERAMVEDSEGSESE